MNGRIARTIRQMSNNLSHYRRMKRVYARNRNKFETILPIEALSLVPDPADEQRRPIHVRRATHVPDSATVRRGRPRLPATMGGALAAMIAIGSPYLRPPR